MCRERWSACHWFCGRPSMHVHAYVPAAVDVIQVLRARRDTRHADVLSVWFGRGVCLSSCGAARWCGTDTVCSASGQSDRGGGLLYTGTPTKGVHSVKSFGHERSQERGASLGTIRQTCPVLGCVQLWGVSLVARGRSCTKEARQPPAVCVGNAMCPFFNFIVYGLCRVASGMLRWRCRRQHERVQVESGGRWIWAQFLIL